MVINGGLYVMIVVKADQNNALCTAAASSTGSRRKKRAISLTSWELAIPQSVLQSILNDVSVYVGFIFAGALQNKVYSILVIQLSINPFIQSICLSIYALFCAALFNIGSNVHV